VFKFWCRCRGFRARGFVDFLVAFFRWSKSPHHVKVNPLGKVRYCTSLRVIKVSARTRTFCFAPTFLRGQNACRIRIITTLLASLLGFRSHIFRRYTMIRHGLPRKLSYRIAYALCTKKSLGLLKVASATSTRLVTSEPTWLIK
jgi:hypothetical protein